MTVLAGGRLQVGEGGLTLQIHGSYSQCRSVLPSAVPRLPALLPACALLLLGISSCVAMRGVWAAVKMQGLCVM